MKTTLLLLSVAILFLTLGVQTQEHYKQLHFSSFVVDTHWSGVSSSSRRKQPASCVTAQPFNVCQK